MTTAGEGLEDRPERRSGMKLSGSLYLRGTIWWANLTYQGRRYRFSTKEKDPIKAQIAMSEFLKSLIKAPTVTSPPKAQTVTVASPSKAETSTNLSFEEFYKKEYLPLCEHQRSYETKKYIINSLPLWFRSLKLNQIKVKDIETLRSEILKDREVATWNKVLTILKHAFKKAFQWGYIPEVSSKLIMEVRPSKGAGKRLKYLTQEEFQRLLSFLPEHLKPLVTVAGFTGMRKSELLQLKWQDIDFNLKVIHIKKTKTHEMRTVPMNETVYQTLRQLWLNRNLSCEYVFTYKGKPIRDNFKHGFNTAVRKAGLEDFHFHDLRHCFVSWLSQAGIPLRTIMELSGHKTLSMALRYSHLADRNLKDAVKAIDLSQFPSQFLSQKRKWPSG